MYEEIKVLYLALIFLYIIYVYVVVFQSMAQEFEDETAVALCSAVARHIHETDKNTNPHWYDIFF